MNEFDLYLSHYGMPKRSGRYPWGSGDKPFQHSGDFLSRVDELKRQGLKETEIAEQLGMKTTQLRAYTSIANNERRAVLVTQARDLRDKGYSLNEITKMMGYKNDSSVRSLLNEDSKVRMNQAKSTADFLMKMVDEKGMIDVGAGIEKELNVTDTKMKEALAICYAEGYEVYGGRVPQVTNPNQQTTIKVLCPPGTEHKEIYNYENVNSINEYTSHDGGDTFTKFQYPASLDSSRIQIRYKEDGGIDKDGVIEIRRGCEDLSLGDSHYAQVRILVDGNKYLKGMAVYSDDMPPGTDIIFNTNKSKSVAKMDVLKDIGDNPDNPFGTLIKANGQSYYTDKNGELKLSPINKKSEEGDWNDWKDKLPAQFLSKQPRALIDKQLNLTKSEKEQEFAEIMALTNPSIKKKMLMSFADDCDASAVHLKAAALPRQKFQVILPVPDMRDDQVYAPNFRNGEKVALVRYPHGGTFEIPVLTVNNNVKSAQKSIGKNPLDAIGINGKVAEQLSGADFDGDTVMVIPTHGRNGIKISSQKPLKGLEGFDTKMDYGGEKIKGSDGKDHYYRNGKEYKVMDEKYKQIQMGIASNLITDMTIKGANNDELARAVKYSMVVIDAPKHKLDYRQCYLDNDIAALKKKYQGHYDEDGKYREGVSTLISRAKSPVDVRKRKGSPQINKETGEVTYKEDPTEYIDKKTGKLKYRTQKSTLMAETKDARTLSTGHPVEEAYADYANKMKSLANQARKEAVNTKPIEYKSSARQTYQKEVRELNDALKLSELNAPKERKAQLIANSVVKAKMQSYPDMTKEEKKKLSQQELTKARDKVGAKRNSINFTDKQWEAIQAGAIPHTTLTRMLKYADDKRLKELATPRKAKASVNSAMVSRMKAMKNSGYTMQEIADAMGVSRSTVTNSIKN